MAEQQGGGASEDEDKDLDPSEAKLRKARESGEVPLAREAVQLASLCGGAFALSWLGPALGRHMVEQGRSLFALAHEARWQPELQEMAIRSAPLALGVAGLAAFGAVAVTLAQTKLLVSAKPLAPNPMKLSPLRGLKRMFGPQALVEFGRAMLKLVACGLAMWWVSDGITERLPQTLSMPLEELGSLASLLLERLLRGALLAFTVVALIDFAWVRLRHMKKMRMSRQEMKDEMKESEGDPHIRGRRRQIALRRSRSRAMAEVPKATVIVTNPTHYAVALSYRRGIDAAPRVVARGVDSMAARIRREAEKHGVPILPNPPLARALYRVEEGAQIPAEHFEAVAELIALVWKLKPTL
ncbi:flagellar biosynthesis protein FlhB [Pseudoroseomonas cervicalis]|uniref:EscU/YscU/HrcU family type III secretion system export apparatus switch protein n=1 Tax=Teichococcus cervicalis TaxID=204525 RepID=UPI0027841FA3|nr:EscU/YscU/HrcU family type III secretion system export apparatus switch protein [Pseudoroseomonas cervicalis]MDQ1079517.1 flagellar biosynthetic protein FlhB [Pseudoroseomonas cervicalis]